jgi:cysteine synthase A
VFGKYEGYNFSGSIKDRVAYFVLKYSYERGLIEPRDEIVEVTSGNTGIAFAALGRALGHRVHIIMPDWLSEERYALMELYGATVEKVTRAEGGFIGSLERARERAKTPGVFYPDQFSNEFNVLAHQLTTAPETCAQLAAIGRKPDVFVAGVGTGGTVMGFSRHMRSLGIRCRCHPLEPANSPTMTTGGCKIGSHRLQGISDEFIPAIIRLEELSSIVSVDDGDAILMAQQLNHCGLSVGISTGANFLGALMLLEKEQNPGLTAVTIFSDSAAKYLSTGLCRKEPQKDDHLSKDVEILGFQVHASPRKDDGVFSRGFPPGPPCEWHI